MTNGWAGIPTKIPRHGKALLHALQFQDSDPEHLRELDDSDWNALLHISDDVQLTLTLRHFCREAMPGWVVERVDGNFHNNAIRFDAARALLVEIVTCFEGRGIDYAVLKGPTHSPEFTPYPAIRAQTDCDLLIPCEALTEANAVLVEMGFVPMCGSNSRHLPPMFRPSAWRWTGDYFAIDLPISVDLHYALWDERLERVKAPGIASFWDRRVAFDLEGRSLPALCLEDRLAFASLHLLMHLLHGDLRLHRAWEIGYFLHNSADDQSFWSSWENLQPQGLRNLQAVIFCLVNQWFACKLSPEAETQIRGLEAPIQSWIRQFGWSPIRGLFEPNRDELWMHLTLISARSDKIRVFLSRLFPLRKPGQLIRKNLGDDPRLRLDRRTVYFLRKVRLHWRAFGTTLFGGIVWGLLNRRISKRSSC